MLRLTGDTFELARIESLQDQYMTEHFLHYYALGLLTRKTRKDKPNVDAEPQQFSLKTMQHIGFSLRRLESKDHNKQPL